MLYTFHKTSFYNMGSLEVSSGECYTNFPFYYFPKFSALSKYTFTGVAEAPRSSVVVIPVKCECDLKCLTSVGN